MKALIIGLGAIGSRHKSTLDKLGYQTFTVSSHSKESSTNFHSLPEAISKIEPSYVVVANNTADHLKTLIDLEKIEYKGKVLVEKPLDFKSHRSNFKFEKIGVGFNLRFLSSIIELKRIITENQIEIHAAEVYYGNLYSNWRDENRIFDQYSSLKSKGGGILRDFSHEIDLLIWLFGKPKINFSIGGKVGNNTIDSDDCWHISASTPAAPIVSLHLNSLDSTPKREIRLLTSLGTICLDITKNQMNSGGKEISYEGSVESTYELMHKDLISHQGKLIATIEESLEVDRVIYAIESIRYGA